MSSPWMARRSLYLGCLSGTPHPPPLSVLGSSSHQITVTAGDACWAPGPGRCDALWHLLQPLRIWRATGPCPTPASTSELGILQGGVSSTTFAPDRTSPGGLRPDDARWLGLNLEDYAGVGPSYADADDIPSWDYSAIQALHTLGILEGAPAATGSPTSTLGPPSPGPRAMTILGRVLEKDIPRPPCLTSQTPLPCPLGPKSMWLPWLAWK